MGERNIEDLEGLAAEAGGTAGKAVEGEAARPAKNEPPKVVKATPTLVDINYPDPVLLSVIVRDVAKWSGQCFVMEPSVNTKVQIFAPNKLTMPQAYELFLASLSIVNLRAVAVGNVVKIVQSGLPTSA